MAGVNDYVKVEKRENIEKFILESFIYENNFDIFHKNTFYSGILISLEKDFFILRYSDLLPDIFSPNNSKFRLNFNNPRGKFYTYVEIVDRFEKSRRTFLKIKFPDYLFRLQRRNSIRVIPDYVHYPVNVKLFIHDNEILLKVRDIGLDGFAITLSKESGLAGLKKGDIVDAELNFPGSNWYYKTKAELVHGAIILSKYRAGFKFIEPEPTLKNEIINYLVVRRIEIKEKILKKRLHKDIKENLGEWLEEFIKYEPEKFKDFKIGIICEDEKKEVFSFLFEKFPIIKFFNHEGIENLHLFKPYLVIFHITEKTKSKWYKFAKDSFFQYTPTILVHKDEGILHLLKYKSFYSTIVKEDEIKNKLINKITEFSNVLIPKIEFESLKKRPYFDGDGKRVAIIDDSIFGFSAKTLLNGTNFKAKIFNNLEEFSYDEVDLVLIDPENYNFKPIMMKILSLIENGINVIVSFKKNYEFGDYFIKFLSENNILLKPYKYDVLLNKFMINKDDIQDKPSLKPQEIYCITNNYDFIEFLKNIFENTIYEEIFDFKKVDLNNYSKKDNHMLLNLNDKFDFNKLKSFFDKNKKIYGIIYRPIHKKLVLNYIKIGLKNILVCKDKNQTIEKLKEFIFIPHEIKRED